MRLSNGECLMAWPLAQHVITTGWTYNDGSAHRAIDLRASVGTPVFATESGTVDQVQEWDCKTETGMQSYGNMVRIKHPDWSGMTLQTRYAHLDRIFVHVGDHVNEGELIGYSGQTGNCFGAHLHYEVICNGNRVNPLNWLDTDFAYVCTLASLGSYVSVVKPVEQEASSVEGKRQVITVANITRGDYEALCEKLVVMGKTCSVTFTITTEPLEQKDADRIYLECVKRQLTNGNYSSEWEV